MKTETGIMFRCPRCGSECFGTSDALGERANGYCSGTTDDHGSRSCSFRWPRAEDWRCFVRVTVETFENRKEYEAASR